MSRSDSAQSSAAGPVVAGAGAAPHPASAAHAARPARAARSSRHPARRDRSPPQLRQRARARALPDQAGAQPQNRARAAGAPAPGPWRPPVGPGVARVRADTDQVGAHPPGPGRSSSRTNSRFASLDRRVGLPRAVGPLAHAGRRSPRRRSGAATLRHRDHPGAGPGEQRRQQQPGQGEVPEVVGAELPLEAVRGAAVAAAPSPRRC